MSQQKKCSLAVGQSHTASIQRQVLSYCGERCIFHIPQNGVSSFGPPPENPEGVLFCPLS
jgi:hypothetical protein